MIWAAQGRVSFLNIWVAESGVVLAMIWVAWGKDGILDGLGWADF